MDPAPDPADVAAHLAERCHRAGISVAVAESLTGGMVASALAKAPRASDWFCGGLVAYRSEVKHRLLDVPPGPVVSAAAARSMATGVSLLLRADLGIGLTGVGGPDSQDGEPPGSVWLSARLDVRSRTVHRRFDGPPEEVCRAAAVEALRLAIGLLHTPPPHLDLRDGVEVRHAAAWEGSRPGSFG